MIQYDQSSGNNQGKADEEKLALLTADELLVYETLGPYPVHIDDLARTVSLGPGRLSSILLKLELNDLVQQSPGNFFTVAPSSN
jgi:predicted Rossmann fold nucleotide-binding protein DprA/Smf involved in DNA uptake